MKVLLSGKKGKLYDAVAQALAGLRGVRLEAVSPGSQLLEAVQAPSAKALVFTLSSESEIEPLRWVIQQNRNLTLLVVLPRSHPKLRELLREEGVMQIVEMPSLTASQLQSKLRESLKALSVGRLPTRPSAHAAHLARDLHTARSALTAILGNAELALPKCRPSSPQQKQLQDIIRGVDEIERILRRLERALGITQKTPS
ncbi:MAG: hypothetical protein A3H27_14820 [Acidobacteria bacterium RIFCSPLOWO2_02_FULL_59_13]|nr:MAG: hypothetical protein A3H27_14820 [Acidobacteria bacterium RIFCSPLOWO2_02_FULL_59_13]